MDVVVKRARAVAGRIAAPPSKSMAHRAVLCAALAKGTSHLHHLAFSKDISATLGAAGRLCARVTPGENDAVVTRAHSRAAAPSVAEISLLKAR